MKAVAVDGSSELSLVECAKLCEDHSDVSNVLEKLKVNHFTTSLFSDVHYFVLLSRRVAQ